MLAKSHTRSHGTLASKLAAPSGLTRSSMKAMKSMMPSVCCQLFAEMLCKTPSLHGLGGKTADVLPLCITCAKNVKTSRLMAIASVTVVASFSFPVVALACSPALSLYVHGVRRRNVERFPGTSKSSASSCLCVLPAPQANVKPTCRDWAACKTSQSRAENAVSTARKAERRNPWRTRSRA